MDWYSNQLQVQRYIALLASNIPKATFSDHMLRIKVIKTSYEIAQGKKPQNTFDEKLTLVHFTIWCRLGTTPVEPISIQIYVAT